jgi:ABC-2 type transport system permease protein
MYHLVFGEIMNVTLREPRVPYTLHVLAGILPWTFFTAATSAAMYSIVASSSLVKKVKLPLEVFPLAAVCSQAVHFALAMLVLVGAMLFFGLAPGPGFLLLPLIAAIQFLIVLAVALLLASLNVFYRDVASVWEVVMAAWFYATPIIYPLYLATDYFAARGWAWARWLYMANPMTPILIAYRRVVLYAGLDEPIKEMNNDAALALAMVGVAIGSIALLWIARRIFARLARRFADEL